MRVFCMSRMPFGWKHSPLFCQTALGRIVRPLVPEGYILFHYLDDFFILGPDPVRLRVVTARVVRALEEGHLLCGFRDHKRPASRPHGAAFIHDGNNSLTQQPLNHGQHQSLPSR